MTLQSSISQALEMASAYPDNDYSFLSVGNPNSKAVVHLFKNKRNLKNNIIKFLEKYRKNQVSVLSGLSLISSQIRKRHALKM